MEHILDGHSDEVASGLVWQLAGDLAALHDLGKGGAEFQKYIRDTGAYSGDPAEKVHAPLSAMLALLIARREKRDVLEGLILAAAALGHHGAMPTTSKLREIGGGHVAATLRRQVNTLNWAALEESTKVSLKGIDGIERPWAVAQRYLDDDVLPQLDRLPVDRAVDFRLRTQLVFSILLEADKAFLAVANPAAYLHQEQQPWQSDWVEKRIGNRNDGRVNSLRQQARKELCETLATTNNQRLFSLSAPTGIGKTLLSATWALKMRESLFEQLGRYPRIIVVLPFLSIIDQTASEYEDLLRLGGYSKDGSWLLTSHSLSDRKYIDNMEVDTERFFIDTWRTEVVITTYDQFLLSLLEPKARYQMRFHNLCDALIIFDEVQSLPCKLWRLFAAALESLTRIGNSRVLLMSATLPSFIAGSEPLLKNHRRYFERCERYELHLRLAKTIELDRFCEEMNERLPQWLSEQRRVLITLNTRQSARFARDALKAAWPSNSDTPLLFITADVTPKDRLHTIKKIKGGNPCVVIATQCIEAGVDIDMDTVIRDFGPLDSLVQIAGRCNREWSRALPGKVEVVDIVNRHGRRYSEMVYDDVHLEKTRKVLRDKQVIKESNVLPLAEEYFSLLSEAKDTGNVHLERFARWEEGVSIRELLRGKDREEYVFLVIEQDSDLKLDMGKAQRIDDRWERREAWRKLAARIARISVTVYARKGFHPEDIATEYLGHWLPRDGYYQKERGLMLEQETDRAHTYIF